MRKNCKEAMQAWTMSKTKKTADSIWTENGKMYSYNTVILQRKWDAITGQRTFYLNMTKYSVTTSIHQNAIYSALRRVYPDAIFIVFRDLPLNVYDLTDFYPSDKHNYTIEECVA